MIALRKNNAALYEGKTEVLDTEEGALLAFKRVTDQQEILVLANMGNKELEFPLETGATDLLTGESLEGSVTVGKLELQVLELD
jgi:glycosidase